MQIQNEQTSQPPKSESRRKFLRRAAVTAIGAGIIFVGLNWTGGLDLSQVVGSVGSSVTTSNHSATRAQLITVTVFYSMMAQFTDLSQEVFVLQSPASLKELINTVEVRHPSMAHMMQMMLTLVNGVPANLSTSLGDGDAVQLVPLSAGG